MAGHAARLITARALLDAAASPPGSAMGAFLPSGWAALDARLPGGGFPHGVLEVASPAAVSGMAVALLAVRAALRQAPQAWCAWVDPSGSLTAPGLAAAGIDRRRLLVVCPAWAAAGRIAVKLVQAQAFAVVVAEVDGWAGAATGTAAWGTYRQEELWVRRLSLANAAGATSVLLLTDAEKRRPMPLPAAQRWQVARTVDALQLRIAKQRAGALAGAWGSNPGSSGAVHHLPWADAPLGLG